MIEDISCFPLLSTKFQVPQFRGKRIHRPALHAKLSSFLRTEQKVLLISAPAGFGKTSLLAEWYSFLDQQTDDLQAIDKVWLTLDEFDNDIVRFFSYLIFAIQRHVPGFGSPIFRLLRTPQLPPIGTILITLINALQELPSHILISLDNYQAINEEKIHRALDYMINRLPDNIQILISTRVDPPFPLSLWRGRGDLSEIRETDLRFSMEEMRQYLELSLTDAEWDQYGALIEHRTEGWPAVLHLLQLALSGKPSNKDFFRDLGKHQDFIADFFMDEILSKQTEEIRDFLLRSSIVRSMKVELCDHVLGTTTSRDLIDQLSKANLLIDFIDSKNHWFRYNHLLSELLLHQLQIRYPQEVQNLHVRASQWYEKEKMYPEAVEHLLLAGRVRECILLISANVSLMWQQGEQDMLLRWCQQIPEEDLLEDLTLPLYYIRMLIMSGKSTKAVKLLDSFRSKKLKDRSKDDPKITLLEGLISLSKGAMQTALRSSEQALQGLPPDQYDWRSLAGVTLGAAYGWLGDIESSTQAYRQALHITQQGNIFYSGINASFRLATNLIQLGDLWEAYQICSQQIRIIDSVELISLPIMGCIHAVEASILYAWSDLSQMQNSIAKAIESAERGMESHFQIFTYYNIANIYLALGQMDTLRKILVKIERFLTAQNIPPTFVNMLHGIRIRSFLIAGEIEKAKVYINRENIKYDGNPDFQSFEKYIALTYFHLQKALADANDLGVEHVLEYLDALLEKTETSKLVNKTIHLLVLKSIFQFITGRKNASSQSIIEACQLARSKGYKHLFIDFGSVPHEFLDFTRSLDGVEEQFLISSRTSTDRVIFPKRTANLITVLTEREMDVLRLLPTYLTGMEIAEELGIAFSTVQTHIKRIYMKLDVHSRSAAVETAKRLGILVND